MSLNAELVHFLVVSVFSFLVGLELKTYREQVQNQQDYFFFGTARTYTFAGILGFVAYIIEPRYLVVYVAILISFALLFAILYMYRLKSGHQSILPYVVFVLVYSFGPLTQLYPLWMPSLLFVLIVFVLNAKHSLEKFSKDINMGEFETLSKMILLSAVILPLLPDKNVISYLPISPFKLWLAVVVISGISYGGYLVQRYLLPSKGYFLTGIFGGLYSSTATTVVLARKARSITNDRMIDAGIISATSMMYLRLLIIAFVFNISVARELLVPFVTMVVVGMAVALVYMQKGIKHKDKSDYIDTNPLELGTAFLFAGLFVVMMVLTQYVTTHYGNMGLHILSFIVGFTDIDPFILSILTGKYSVDTHQLVSAVLIASGSNNILKSIYALWFGGIKGGMHSALWVSLLGVCTILWAFYT